MDGPIFGLCALIAAIGTGICARYAYARRNEPRYQVARWARVAAVAVCCFGSILAIPAVAQALSEATNIDNVAKLGAHLSAVAFCASLQIVIVDWTHRDSYLYAGIYSRIALTVAVMVALALQFEAANNLRVEFTTDYADNGQVVAYLLTYLGFAAVSGLEIAVLSTGMAIGAWKLRAASGGAWKTRRTSALGLTIAAAGGTSCVAYTISKGGYLIAFQTGHPWSLDTEKAISSPLAGFYILFMVTGLCTAMVGRRKSSASLSAD